MKIKLRLFINGLELKHNSSLSFIEVIAEVTEHENETAFYNPHSLKVHTTYSPRGILTDIESDAYTSGPSLVKPSVEVVCSSWQTWEDVIQENLE